MYRYCSRDKLRELKILLIPSIFLLVSLVFWHENRNFYMVHSKMHCPDTRHKDLIRNYFVKLWKTYWARRYAFDIYDSFSNDLRCLQSVKLKSLISISLELPIYSNKEFHMWLNICSIVLIFILSILSFRNWFFYNNHVKAVFDKCKQ